MDSPHHPRGVRAVVVQRHLDLTGSLHHCGQRFERRNEVGSANVLKGALLSTAAITLQELLETARFSRGMSISAATDNGSAAVIEPTACYKGIA